MFLQMVIKEVKQFTRNKGNVIMMFIFPILLITVLGYALDSLMGDSIDIFDGKILYKIEEQSTFEDGFNSLMENLEDEFDGIEFEEISDLDKAKDEVINNKAYGLVTVHKDGYDYYRNEKLEAMGSKVFRSILEGVIDKYTLMDIAIKENPMIMEDIIDEETNKYIENSSVGTRVISSIDYYTFAELALIILYVSSIVGESVIKEKELSTINRIRLSKANDLKLISSKITLGLIISVIQIVTVYFYSTIVLGANWGENIGIMIANLLALALLSVTIGAVLGMLIKDGKSLNGVLNICIIVLCFLGGCYTPLSMIKSIPLLGSLTAISPIYWVNSALISLSSGVEDIYSHVAISICILSSIGLVALYLGINKIKGGKKIA